MKRLLLPLLAALALPTAVNAFWGLSEEEKTICRDRASRERNEFSAKQAYNYCKKNIKSESKKKKEKERKRDKLLKYGCEKEGKALENCEWKSFNKCEKWDKENPDWKLLPDENGSLVVNPCPYRSEISCRKKEESARKCNDRLEGTKKGYGL